MDLHTVRRISSVLVASQVRSGRSTSNPTSFFGQPIVFAVIDGVVFVVLFVGALVLLPGGSPLAPVLRSVLLSALPFVPLYTVGAVLVAGIMFELTATAKFSGSDAVNWLPVSPSEYVLGSSTAIAYTYSPALAFLLGPLSAVALRVGLGGSVVLVAFLGVLGLFMGAFLVEMVRSVTQRVGRSGGRRGRYSLALQAVALLLLILAVQLAFNPVFLFDSLSALGVLAQVSAYIPPFWSVHALSLWLAGDALGALLFVAAQVVFAVLLLYAAAELRVRYWVVADTEYRFEALEYAADHPVLAALGLDRAESAIATKDFRSLTRRREMLPMLVIPFVLFIAFLVENAGANSTASPLGHGLGLVLAGWSGGLFALLLAVASVGQERRAVQTLFAAPITGRSVFRAKVAAVLLPGLGVTVAVSAAASVIYRIPLLDTLAYLVVAGAAAVAVALWGLAFASRYSDFQDRPRPQYLRPLPMTVASFSGLVLLFAILLPGAYALGASGTTAVAAAVGAAALALTFGSVGGYVARSGFDRLFRELPF